MAMLGYLWVQMGQFPERVALRPAVLVYGLILLGMVMSSASRWRRVKAAVFWRGFVGAGLFMLSDSLIGLNYLAWERPLSGVAAAIFLTYAAAQYLLVGVLCSSSE